MGSCLLILIRKFYLSYWHSQSGHRFVSLCLPVFHSRIWIGSYLWSIGEEMHRWYIKQIQSIVVMVMFSKISQRTSNVVRTSVTHLAATCVSFLVLTTFWHHYSFVSDYNLTTSVVNYWTEAWQHGIYLSISFNPLERKMDKITVNQNKRCRLSPSIWATAF